MTKKKKTAVIGAVIAAFVLLSAESCDTTSTDRDQKAPDGFKNTTKVIVWKNADNVPNLATFCADNLAWAATLSDDGAKQPAVLRVPEHDSACAN